jgi:hypothetical protein
VLLARTLRQVAQAKYLQERQVSAKAEQEQVAPEVLAVLPEENSLYGGNKAWLRGRLWEQARRLSWPQLQQALDRLAVADAGTKGWEYGVEDPDLALEVYIAALCDMVKPEAAGGASRPRGNYPPRR